MIKKHDLEEKYKVETIQCDKQTTSATAPSLDGKML
jgi:hypothetical protein